MEKDGGRSISLSKGRKRSRSGAGRGSGNHHPPTHQDDGGSAKTTVVDKMEQALDQWNSLVEREENDAYQIIRQGNNDSACPAAWREKICEWCFQVVDHW